MYHETITTIIWHIFMTSLMTSPGHKIGQISKLIYLRQYLSYSVDQKLKMSEMLMAIFLVYSTSGVTSGKKSAHPWGLSHQLEMSSGLLACWSLQSCLGASCVRGVFHIFLSYLRELKLSLTMLGVKVGQNTQYSICNCSVQNFHMHFEESISIEWVLR